MRQALICIARAIVLFLLRLRYAIRVHNLEPIRRRGTRGVLFLPTHPALIDPVILTTLLMRDFHARPFADQDAIDLPVIRGMASRLRAFTIPSMARYGSRAAERIEETLNLSIDALRAGDNVILYPAGGTLRSRREIVGGNSAVDTILRALPDVRVVLVRTRGLWGSSFSQIYGRDPDLRHVLGRGCWQVLSNFVFFTPRRQVDITFEEPAAFPRAEERATVNAWIERYYNQDAPSALYVPYTIWERGGRREMPDPDWGGGSSRVENVPATIRQLVEDWLRDRTGASSLRDGDGLAHDLGMDSLARADLLAWVESEFGLPQGNTDSLRTVADVLLAASGEALARADVCVRPAPPRWYSGENDRALTVPPAATITEAFLKTARRAPNTAAVADATSGVKTWRELVMGVLALLPAVRALPGEHVGIMLPATVAACLSYLTVLFAGRTPVMINWTVGRRNVLHGLELTGTQVILTVKPLIAKLQQQGLDLSGLEGRFVYLEDLAASLSRGAKLRAFLLSHLSWASLRSARTSETAAILFTSGSESLPKAVPLSHRNILTELDEVLKMVAKVVSGRDRILAMLPPFHSFGLAGNVVLPLVGGVPAVYYPNPTEGAALAQTMGAYRATIAIATPTFLAGMLRAGTQAQLASLRLAVTGAEECPPRVYDLAAERCPKAILIEGYGITECSPVVALNLPEDPRPHTVGRLLASVEHAVVDVDSGQAVTDGAAGMLLLRGPTIFGGYLGDAPDPFVTYDGKRWYRTGDLVRASTDGVFTFAGRLKRFVKYGGEMISLPAIESVLQEAFPAAGDEGPSTAVVATTGDYPELVLFTTLDVDRERANAVLRAAGLSALHNIRRVERVDALPLLGTGKLDYRSVQAWLEAAPA